MRPRPRIDSDIPGSTADTAAVTFDLGSVRFATSPVLEAVASLRLLHDRAPHSLHQPWIQVTRRLLAAHPTGFPVLNALVPAHGHFADFLTPPPRSRRPEFAEELELIASSTTECVLADLKHLGLHRWQPDPRGLAATAAAELSEYWKIAIAPHQPLLRSLVEADIAWRTEELASRGVRHVISTLHPAVRLGPQGLLVATSCSPKQSAPPDAPEVVLVPCAFAWPGVFFLASPGWTPTLTYAPRGVAALWETRQPSGRDLAGLVGRTRSTILELLALPMTTGQLATHVESAPSTISGHLKALERAAVVVATRSGRYVYYGRTALGDLLVNENT